jgi:NADH-quinone oxidoreductase subunit A
MSRLAALVEQLNAVLGDLGVWSVGFWSMMMFLGILTVGFIYEWKKGALDWE